MLSRSPGEGGTDYELAKSSADELRTREGKIGKWAVIDEDMIMAAVREDGEAEEDALTTAGAAALAGGGSGRQDRVLNLDAITSLSLSFRHILRIDNLSGFDKLVKLQLDNNGITQISGLSHLVNLRWLDLSFNRIRRVEGLSSLTQLEDLCLSDNLIESADGLESLTQLQVLSLGHNRLRGLDVIRDLRPFRSLRVLNLHGNPVAEEEEYTVTVHAFLTQLKYLDFQRIEEVQVQKARDRMLDAVVEMEERERAEEERERAREEEAKEEARYQAANLGGVRSLFDTLTGEDSEVSKLRLLPGYGDILRGYRDMFSQTLSSFVSEAMALHAQKKEEQSAFRSALDACKRKNDAGSVGLIQSFESHKKQAMRLYTDSLAAGAPEPDILRALRDDLDSLSDQLMDVEMRMTEQANQLVSEFEDRYKAHADTAVALVQRSFRKLEDVANSYSEALHGLVERLVVSFSKGELDLEPEAAALVGDRDAVKNAVTTSHDNHASRIVARADQLHEKEDEEFAALMKRLTDEEYDRNRLRVSAIVDMCELDAAAIDKALARSGMQ
jgi:vacuolar-type H+-ATPase subunit I/STV1